MIIFPVQVDSFRITRIGDRVLQLHTYEQYAEEVSKITNKPMGTEYVIVLMDIIEYNEFQQETPEQTRERFWKQFHAEIGEISEVLKTKPETFKETIKDMLKKEGKIKTSTKELSVEELANQIVRLKNYKNKIQNNEKRK